MPKVGKLLQQRIEQRLKKKKSKKKNRRGSDDDGRQPKTLDDLIANEWRRSEQDLDGFDLPDDFEQLEKADCSIYTNIKYKNGDKVEIFSRSQSVWFKGDITRVEPKKDKVKVEYYIGTDRCKKWLRLNSEHLRHYKGPQGGPHGDDSKSNSSDHNPPRETPALEDDVSDEETKQLPLRRSDTGNTNVTMRSGRNGLPGGLSPPAMSPTLSGRDSGSGSDSATTPRADEKSRGSDSGHRDARRDRGKRKKRKGGKSLAKQRSVKSLTMSEATSKSGGGDDDIVPDDIKSLVKFLPERTADTPRRTLILDSDETLIHSTFRQLESPDIVVPVQTSKGQARCSVMKRPGLDEFLDTLLPLYEIIIFTASQKKYIQPVFKRLDPDGKYFKAILCREYCTVDKDKDGQSHYVKDLDRLGRDLKDVILIDNSPQSYKYHPNNAIPIRSWFNDEKDKQLLELLPVLTTKLHNCKDVRKTLDANKKSFRWVCRQADDSDSDDSDDGSDK